VTTARRITLNNPFLTASFDEATGALVDLRAPRGGESLVTAMYAQYQAGETVFSEDPKAEGRSGLTWCAWRRRAVGGLHCADAPCGGHATF